MKPRFAAALFLAPAIFAAACGGDESATTDAPRLSVDAVTTSNQTTVPTDTAVRPDEVVALLTNTIAVPAGAFTSTEPQQIGPLSYTAVRVGAFDQDADRAWQSFVIRDIVDPEGFFDDDVAHVRSLMVIDNTTVFDCVDERDPMWLGGPREDWQEIIGRSNGLFVEVEDGPFPWADTFDRLISEPELIVDARRSGTRGNRTLYEVDVQPEAVAPMVVTARARGQVEEMDIDLGGPVELSLEVDDDELIHSIEFSADGVAHAILSELTDQEVPPGFVSYSQVLTLGRIAEAEMPVVDQSATSCPDEILAATQ